ncbi:PucR family transcriptional regulator [Nocardioides immobilis]|uniref:PucR family transcriptional regulator n=1 Tax=Nocardioides immobilis TaxID=2049295 RepID=A0A417Y3Y7_9ACTN|nr:PucR family transcriptional regulator [Nocardioides immobilis]RHW27393.1 PucR family transcriptional regulator [Nocardioides immobilis]
MARRSAAPELELPPEVTVAMRAALPVVADDVVAAVIEEVPSYTDAFSGPMGETIRSAVRLALGGFLSLVSEERGSGTRTPTAPAIEGAYQLGRGEARSGRTSEALLSAYRIGAQVAWQRLAAVALDSGVDATTMAAFAQAVWAYIDELSATSAAGHGDESATAGRVKQRLLDRIGQHLLTGAPEKTVVAAAERAEWSPPVTLTAVIVPEAQVGSVLQLVHTQTLQVSDLPELEAAALLLVPDVHGRRRASLLRAVEGRRCWVGPARPWLEARTSYDRARRAQERGLGDDTEAHLPELVLTADPAALADLRAAVLAPLDDLRPASAAKLAETLRAWLLHQGRRDDVAAALFVHPQTVRYRMAQLRELFGDRLEDPETVLALTIALGVEPDPVD